MGNTPNRGISGNANYPSSKSWSWLTAFLTSILFAFMIAGCSDEEGVLTDNYSATAAGSGTGKGSGTGGTLLQNAYEVTNLVADVADYHPMRIDPDLINAWGIAIGPTGAFWISAADSELSVIYDDEGNALRKPVYMEGEPTGQVYNNTDGFVIPNLGPAKFIFATEYGTITAWYQGDTAVTIVDNSAEGASYTGLELTSDGNLLVANVAEGEVEVIDRNWNYVDTKPFINPKLPVGAKPFNVREIDGSIYVTYEAPAGSVVGLFDMSGNFIKNFTEGANLRSPWGITKTPDAFGLGGAFLVGNFGDGRISIITPDGYFKGFLTDEMGQTIMIDGLWDLVFTDGAFNGTADPDLYFTAGPAMETHGIFGEIEPAQ